MDEPSSDELSNATERGRSWTLTIVLSQYKGIDAAESEHIEEIPANTKEGQKIFNKLWGAAEIRIPGNADLSQTRLVLDWFQ